MTGESWVGIRCHLCIPVPHLHARRKGGLPAQAAELGSTQRVVGGFIRKHFFVFTLVTVLGWLSSSGCGSGGQQVVTTQNQSVSTRVFTGYTQQMGRHLALRVSSSGQVEAFVVDGLTNGVAIVLTGTNQAGTLNLRQNGGSATIVGQVQDGLVTGNLALNGTSIPFVASPALAGGGLYLIAVDGKGHFSGGSPDGFQLVGEQNGLHVSGTVTDPNGVAVPFALNDLTRGFPSALLGGAPDQYLAVVSNGVKSITGRGGAQGLLPAELGQNVLLLDLPAPKKVGVGEFFGQMEDTNYLLGIQFTPVGFNGAVQSDVEAYLTDNFPSESPQWFKGAPLGNHFELNSASGDAQMVGDISADGVRGTITLNGRQQKFFAAPAGDGAGVYNLTIDQNLHWSGTSERGDHLTATAANGRASVDITTSTSDSIHLIQLDLVRAFGFPQIASVPDIYLAFVDSAGRFMIGRSGAVRTGSSGLNVVDGSSN